MQHQLFQHVKQVILNSAAEAAIVEHHDELVSFNVLFIGHKLAVYVYLSKLDQTPLSIQLSTKIHLSGFATVKRGDTKHAHPETESLTPHSL